MEAVASSGILPGEPGELALSIQGMRNILVHGYAEVRHDLIYEAIRRDLDGLERILAILWAEA